MRLLPPVLGLLLLSAAPARAQDWVPPSLEHERRAVPIGARELHPVVLEQTLPKVAAKDFRGLGGESARVLEWSAGKGSLYLIAEPSPALATRAGERLPLSRALARVLGNMNRYFGMTPATLARPVSFEELKSSALSPEGAAGIADIFEGSIAGRIRFHGRFVVPEVGGEAAFDSQLRFHLMDDLTRPVLNRIAADADDPEALRRLFAEHPDAMKAADEQGLLFRLLERLPEWERRPVPVTPEQREKVLRLTVETVLMNGADTYLFDPETQFAAIADQDWSGRYAGRWHSHPPTPGTSGWVVSSDNMPSGPDMDIAVSHGQNIVLAFHPEGFDLYDLSPLGDAEKADLGLARKVSYRSAAWQDRFQRLFDRITRGG